MDKPQSPETVTLNLKSYHELLALRDEVDMLKKQINKIESDLDDQDYTLTYNKDHNKYFIRNQRMP